MQEDQNRRVVIEYDFKGYGEPSGSMAELLPCEVIYKPDWVPELGDSLGEIRGNLGLEGFDQVEVEMVKSHQKGRYFPRWREIWVQVEEVEPAKKRPSMAQRYLGVTL